MPVAAQTKHIDPRLLELMQKEKEALIVEWGLLSQGPETPPVKLPLHVIEVASGDRERRDVLSVGGGYRHRRTSPREP